MLPQSRKPTLPGEILKFEFPEPLKMTQQQLAHIMFIKNGTYSQKFTNMAAI